MDAKTYCTVSDASYFLGTVALLNSLHLTDNRGAYVVFDAGLTLPQRGLLEPHVELVPVGPEVLHPVLAKPLLYRVRQSGTIVLVDSDMIVTGSLSHILALAAAGKICAYKDAPLVRRRWFAEWASVLDLRAPLRREPYLNSGFVTLSLDHWPHLLERWWDLCTQIPTDRMWQSDSPFNAPDQDVLNALLMSEIPAEAVAALDPDAIAFGGDIGIEDIETLTCSANGARLELLHYLDHPKPWWSSGWIRLGSVDYVRLMRRLLFRDDVPIRIEPARAPLWLRPTRSGEIALRLLGAGNRAAVRVGRRAPAPVAEHMRRVRRRFD